MPSVARIKMQNNSFCAVYIITRHRATEWRAASQNVTQIRFGNHVDGRPKSDLPLICGQVQLVRGAYYLTTGAAGGRASQLMFT